MQPDSNVRSLDDSLYEGQKALCEIESIVGQIGCHLTGDAEADSSVGCYGSGGALMVADQNTGRLVALTQRLREIRDLISAPKVEQMAGHQNAVSSVAMQSYADQLNYRGVR